MNTFNADSLLKAGRALREPFMLSLVHANGEETEITVQKILRLLPRTRIVAAVSVDGQQFLAKIFVGRYSWRHANREVAGACAIEDTGVLTASLQWRAGLKSTKGHVLAFEYISAAENLLDLWQASANDDQRRRLISMVVPVLAALHQGGVVQNDIHPGNFLLRSDQVYAIDAGNITRHGSGPLGERKSLGNMALFFAQFPASQDHFISEPLEQYRQHRAWPLDVTRVGRLLGLIDKHRFKRKQNHIKKAFRECTRFTCKHSFKRFSICERRYDSPEMEALLEQLDQRMDAGEILKNGNSSTVALVDGPLGPLVIKRYNIKNAGHGISRAFRKTRAWISWGNAYRLEFLGISTLKPVALVEERFGMIKRRAYFITEYINGPDATVLQGKENPDADMLSIAEILNSLSAAGISHGDLKASNFLLAGDGAVIIDLDSMKEHTNPVHRGRAGGKDIARFMKNWESTPEIGQRFAELLD
ncbi:MAG: lipopolysaccharide kinase InaA family protein [Candidatus Azotimanducaceae bacterium WSBS_2022_MAG_OTU7]